MKIQPDLPNEPEPLKKDKGCAFVLLLVVLFVLAGAVAAWMLLWSSGHVEAEKAVDKPVPAERS